MSQLRRVRGWNPFVLPNLHTPVQVCVVNAKVAKGERTSLNIFNAHRASRKMHHKVLNEMFPGHATFLPNWPPSFENEYYSSRLKRSDSVNCSQFGGPLCHDGLQISMQPPLNLTRALNQFLALTCIQGLGDVWW